MAGCKWPENVDGVIKKGTECEFNSYCSKSGVQCGHGAFGDDLDYHCGYCKSFRMIAVLKAEKAALAEEKKDV